MTQKFIFALLLICSIAVNTSHAQVRLSFNIGSQPIWGPVGYKYVDNYYLPEIETYYNVATQQYTYYDKGSWVSTSYLPPEFRNYDLYKGYKVVINQNNPYLRHNIYRDRYVKYRNLHNQKFIRDSREGKYFENKEHPRHKEWKENGKNNRNKKEVKKNNKKGKG
jgi:hypothetical protein